MPGPSRPKTIPIERTYVRAVFPFSFSPLSPPSPSLARQGEKRGHSQSPPEKENQKEEKKEQVKKLEDYTQYPSRRKSLYTRKRKGKRCPKRTSRRSKGSP